jgi:hypothetical protein
MKFTLISLSLSLLFPSFKLDAENSSISYTGSHPFHNFKGITSQIEVITDCNMINLDCGSTISVPVMSFVSGNDNRDSNMLFYIDGLSFPFVKISFSHLNILNLLYIKETVNINGEIDFHGFKILQEIPILIKKEKDTISIQSNFSIQLDAFNVERPSLLMLPIKNEITIDVNISGRFIK